MKEEKFKKIVIGATVAAVVLFVFLLVFWICQMISISVKNRRIEELKAEIAYYQEIIDTSEDDLVRYRSELWLQMAARELGMLGYGDIILGEKT